jgi:hypothetical protein
MNFESNKEKDLVLEEENEMKCYPKVSNNQMPYQKIEKEIRLNKQWPPITEVNEISNGVLQRNISPPPITPIDINNNGKLNDNTATTTTTTIKMESKKKLTESFKNKTEVTSF